MASPKRTRAKREGDLVEVSRMYLAGQLQIEIADQLGVSQQQISYDLAELQKRWLKSSLVNLDSAKGKELAKLDALEREYWEAWERSQRNKEMRTCEAENETDSQMELFPKSGEKWLLPAGGKLTVRQEGQVGDPRFLEGILRCVTKRAEILGLDAPKKIEAALGDKTPAIEKSNKAYRLAELLPLDDLQKIYDRLRERVSGKSDSGINPTGD